MTVHNVLYALRAPAPVNRLDFHVLDSSVGYNKLVESARSFMYFAKCYVWPVNAFPLGLGG